MKKLIGKIIAWMIVTFGYVVLVSFTKLIWTMV